MEDVTEKRITDLEIRLTHQEAAMEEMNSVLLTQHNLMGGMQDDIKRLRRQLQDVSADGVASQGDEQPPPHY